MVDAYVHESDDANTVPQLIPSVLIVCVISGMHTMRSTAARIADIPVTTRWMENTEDLTEEWRLGTMRWR
ncbi:hypothetical protein C6369_002535 [Rhodococcus rhodochrous]|nr:hypothetical protein C6369_002535 [Rhodococcus rhodochrous]